MWLIGWGSDKTRVEKKIFSPTLGHFRLKKQELSGKPFVLSFRNSVGCDLLSSREGWVLVYTIRHVRSACPLCGVLGSYKPWAMMT